MPISPLAYDEAVQNPRYCFKDPELKAGQTERDSKGMPLPSKGTFGIVYHVHSVGKGWAVKCFFNDNDFPDMQERYSAIGQHLKKVSLPYTMGFDYLPDGIRVSGKLYPILKMEWLQGDLLSTYIERHLQNPNALKQLAQRWLIMAKKLKQAHIAHGDLQDGNVLVVNGTIKLVDYDGMFVPGLANKPSYEQGHPNYQHPQRETSRHFGPKLDHFSLWVIYLSLVALSVDPGIWSKVNGGDQCLIFRKEDFERPSQSKVLNLLRSHTDAHIRDLTTQLRSFLDISPAEVPPLGEIIPPPPVTVTVSASGRGQYRSIAEALRSVKPSTRIKVLPGLYTEGLVIDKQVEIVGVGAVKDIVVETTDASCVLMHTDAATVRGLTLRCRAGEDNFYYFFVDDNFFAVDVPQGRLELQGCDISSDTYACVAIHGTTANPTIRHCRIHDGQFGIDVAENGQGIVEDCSIFNNTRAGVQISQRGNPTIRRCDINQNEDRAVWVCGNGAAPVENCDLTENAGGAWYIEATCQVKSKRNIPPTPVAILQALAQFEPQNDLHVSPNIPQNKLSFALESCDVPSWEDILGMIDCTFLGSAKDCILFGREGIYFHQFLDTPGDLQYSAFPQCTFEVVSLERVRTGYGADLSVFRSAMRAEQLCAVLQTIKNLMKV